MGGLLVVPVLVAGGLYLARSSGADAPPRAPGLAIVRPATDPCGAAAAGICAGSPIHVSMASVLASAQTKRPPRGGRPRDPRRPGPPLPPTSRI
jgi:hypothetical protein